MSKLIKMEIKEYGDIKFSTGKVVNANNGIVGIDHGFNIYGGYNSTLFDRECWDEDMNLSKQEQLELAEHMINKWGELKASLLAP